MLFSTHRNIITQNIKLLYIVIYKTHKIIIYLIINNIFKRYISCLIVGVVKLHVPVQCF